MLSAYIAAIDSLDAELALAETKLEASIIERRGRTDGGSTQSLLNLINQAPALPASELVERLRKAAPLSDTVMIMAIKRYYPLPDAALRDAMLPNCPLTGRVMDALYERQPAVSAVVWNQLLAANQGESHWPELHGMIEELNTFKAERQHLASEKQRQRIWHGLKPEAGDKEAWLRQRQQAELYLAAQQLDSVRLTITLIAQDTVRERLEENAQYIEFLQTLLTLADSGRTIYEMEPDQLQKMREIAATYTKAGAKAEVVLGLVENTPTARFIVPLNDNNEARKTSKFRPHSREVTASKLKLYPNPASTEVQVEFELVEKGGSQIVLINALGREQNSFFTDAQVNFLTLPLKNIVPGLYLIQLRTGAKVIAQQKLVVER